MNELKLQKLLVDTVKGAGGYAMKMDNKYIVGVSDLLTKLPNKLFPSGALALDFPAGMVEVKQRKRPVRDISFTLDITHMQAKFLDDVAAAGMPAGVASFLQEGTGSGLKLYLFVCTWKAMQYVDSTVERFEVHRDAHELLNNKDRAGDIMRHLYRWHDNWRAGK